MQGLAALVLLVSVAAPPEIDVAAGIQAALDFYGYEPACSEVVKKVLKAAKGKKVTLPSTKAIHASALLPLLRVSVTKNLEYDESLSLEQQDDAALKIYTDNDLQLKITVQWDLAALVFNGSESAVVAKAQAEAKWKMQVVQTVVEIYHLRRKLQVLLFLLGGTLPVETQTEWTLKVQELTALLDALSGDWFSEEAEARRKKMESGG
jgi:hypothetical protein